MAQTLSRPGSKRPGAASLYDKDFMMWIEGQVRLLRTGELDALDIENVAEELESMGKRDRRSLESHLAVIQAHLLKLRAQPEQRSKSWLRSIANSRARIARILRDSPSLKKELPALLASGYLDAVRNAAIDTGLPRTAFPTEPPSDLGELLDRPLEEL